MRSETPESGGGERKKMGKIEREKKKNHVMRMFENGDKKAIAEATDMQKKKKE